MSLIGTAWLSEFRRTVACHATRTITNLLQTTSGWLALLVDYIDGLYERRIILLGSMKMLQRCCTEFIGAAKKNP